MKSVARQQVTSDYDDYGFKIFSDYEVEDLKLLAKIQALEIRSHNLLQQEGVERPLLDRWAQYLTGRSDDHLTASQELKGLLRAGVPQEYRHRLWSWMLCAKSQTSPHPASRQIELDLPAPSQPTGSSAPRPAPPCSSCVAFIGLFLAKP
ncbi:TBC1 domain family member 2A-like [Takifugu rubripes]|uniref:TBC1 domain family member 2A-like n=1 Tax=Takifugu rubripes TaxID=31033 RepID=UPI0011458CB5|nr:TBC1 domain family member 2A-like [Takifugu rubripes]